MEKRRGTSDHLYLAERQAGRWGAPDAMPDVAGGEEGSRGR